MEQPTLLPAKEDGKGGGSKPTYPALHWASLMHSKIDLTSASCTTPHVYCDNRGSWNLPTFLQIVLSALHARELLVQVEAAVENRAGKVNRALARKGTMDGCAVPTPCELRQSCVPQKARTTDRMHFHMFGDVGEGSKNALRSQRLL